MPTLTTSGHLVTNPITIRVYKVLASPSPGTGTLTTRATDGEGLIDPRGRHCPSVRQLSIGLGAGQRTSSHGGVKPSGP